MCTVKCENCSCETEKKIVPLDSMIEEIDHELHELTKFRDVLFALSLMGKNRKL